MWGKRGWAEHPAGERLASDAEGSETSNHNAIMDKQHKSHATKQQQEKQKPTETSSNHRSMFQIALSIIYLIPGAERVSFFNAAVLGILGALAALAAAGGGLGILAILLARWYLPAIETHVTLPMHFDYAAGPSAAGAWIPLLRPSPISASLSPPLQRVSAAAAGLAPIQFQGNLGPGSSLSFSSSSSSSSGGTTGFWGQEGGFLGLGFGPASRSAAAAAKSKVAARSGWFRRGRSKAAAGSSGSSGVGGLLGGVDVGSGVSVPERDWLVPLWGRMGLKVVLEMPGWPETDLVQVTSEVVSQQGIVLGRSTRTWVPKPKPLLFRLTSSLIFGPWRALGLIDDTVRVQLPMFEAFQNPQAPPGGWGSVLELLKPNPATDPAAKGSKEGSAKESAGVVAGGKVVGPRAMWLRVTMIGRSAERGPPRVYKAAAVLDMRLGPIDRIAAALRPSIPACILILFGSSILATVSGSTAAALLFAAYALYSAGSSIAAAGRDTFGTADQTKDISIKDSKHDDKEEYKPQGSAGSSSMAGSGGPGSRVLGHVDSDLSHATGVVGVNKAADEQGFDRGFSPASADESSSSETYEDATGDQDITSRLLQTPQQQQQSGQGRGTVAGGSSPTTAVVKGEAVGMQPKEGIVPLQATGAKAGDKAVQTQQQQQQQQQQQGQGGSDSAVSAIARMVGVKEQQQQQLGGVAVQQQQQQRAVMRESGEAEAEEELMHDAGVSGVAADADDEWQEQLLAESDAADSSSSSDEAAAAGSARKATRHPAGEGYTDESAAVAAAAAGPSKRLGYAYQT